MPSTSKSVTSQSQHRGFEIFGSGLRTVLVLVLGAATLPSQHALAQSGTLIGRVTDAGSDDPLPGATVAILGTALGTATDVEGEFWLRGAPQGGHTIRASYIGYSSVDTVVTVPPGGTVRLALRLRPVVVRGEEVVITAQLEGQQKAINQQLSANTIVNVVAAERIQELPDRNAAETLGRLPGISVQRNAGEGQKVVVRGLAPKFNSITVNGERIPSTDESDRSVDLSMISPEMLAGIEVFKSLTPDKDGDAVGGTVNFVIAEARQGTHGDLRVQGGYSDHVGTIENFKTTASASNRFLGDRLGIIASANIERADRSSDLLDADYSFQRTQSGGQEVGVHRVENLNLAHRVETRYRGGGGLTADYRLNNGSLLFSMLFSRTDRDELRRRRRYRLSAAYTEYDFRQREVTTSLWTNSISGKHDFGLGQLTWRSSYSRTVDDRPREFNGRFRELAAYTSDLIDTQGPDLIPDGAKRDLNATWFKEMGFDSVKVKDRDLTAQADVRFPIRLSTSLAGYLKVGAKHRDKARDRDKSRFWSDHFGINDIGADYYSNPDAYYRDFDLDLQRRILISSFTSSHDAIGDEFLDGRFEFGPTLDMDELLEFAETFEGDFIRDPFVDLEVYEASEAISSGYVMTELNIGPSVMFLPGVRYERTSTEYTSVFGRPGGSDDGQPGSIIGRTDTTGGQDYGEWLPMLHLRVKPTGWFDVRLATTRTLSRPDYFNLVPWERVSIAESELERGNSDLKHAYAWNYDAYLSVYNRWGLFTVGAFYKNVWDIDYIRASRVTEGEFSGFRLTQPENSIGKSEVIGIEFDIQTNLSWLPSPFDGCILFMNYTLIDSETPYPLLKIGPRSPTPPFAPTLIDTVRTGSMPGQADYLANAAIGYEKGGFSGRLSVVFQGRSLEFVGSRAELDGYTDAFARWDLILQQDLGRGLQLFANANNITNRAEGAFLANESLTTREEYFGWSGDVGVRFKF